MQEIAHAELAGTCDVTAGPGTGLEIFVDPADRVADPAIAAEITSRKAEARIDLPEALACDHILTREQTRSAEILGAYCNCGQPSAFVPKPNLEVNRLVLVVLVSGN